MRGIVCGVLTVILSLTVYGKSPAGQSAESKIAPLSALRWQDIAGHSYDQTTFSQRKATVFVFLSTQCPIANRYTPRLRQLIQTYTPRDVAFFLVHANPEDTLPTLQRYTQERDFPCPTVQDEGTQLADALHADRTPEAILVDTQALVRYRGRIDDNPDPQKVIRHDLQEALDAVLAGKPVTRSRTLSFGCAIFRDRVAVAPSSKAAVTYTRDVAGILYKNCVVCHRAGEAAPFSLVSYPQAKTWASAIKEYTARGVMPPWKAVPGHGEFLDAKVLTEGEKGLLARWAESGAVQGDPKDLPPFPKFPSPTAWSLGKPDAILQPEGVYKLAAEGNDVYRNFVLPVDTSEDRYLRAIDYKPNNRAAVHHIVIYFDLTGQTEDIDRRDPGPGYTVPGSGIGVPFYRTIWVGGWAPGNVQRFLPDGVAMKLPRDAKLVMQVHYHKTGKVEYDRSQIGLYFVPKSQVRREARMEVMANRFFVLKPNVANQVVPQSITLKNDIHVWTVSPHMHHLGREFTMTATLPNGDKTPMIYIRDWDFNWQETYRYKQPLRLPKGTRIDMAAVYDNTEQNPRQLSHPPREVRWGEQTADEMCLGLFQYSIDPPRSSTSKAR